MPLYEFKCYACRHHFDAFGEQKAQSAPCPLCGQQAARRYSVPVTDCHSFGRNQYRARTPEHLRRARSADQERTFRDAAHESGARVQFGPGKTTGT